MMRWLTSEVHFLIRQGTARRPLVLNGFALGVLLAAATLAVVLPTPVENALGAQSLVRTYDWATQGDPIEVEREPLCGGLALMGGGTDVDSALAWMAERANGGDFVVLRASGTDAYNEHILRLTPSLNSVTTLIVPTREGADDPFVCETIQRAEAVFIAGGDQAHYVTLWKNTGLERALHAALVRRAPVGGASAGLAVLGSFDFAALEGTITSVEALTDPYDPRVTIDRDFLTPRSLARNGISTALRHLEDVATDSHFQERDRMGRLLTFLARVEVEGWASRRPRGIAVNEQTALLVEEDGSARVVGNALSVEPDAEPQVRAVYFLETTERPTSCVAGRPLSCDNVSVVRAICDPTTGRSDSFHLASWTGGAGTHAYRIRATNGVVSSDRPEANGY